MITLCCALALLLLLLLRHPRCPPARPPPSLPPPPSPASSPIQRRRSSLCVDEFGRLPSNPSPARTRWSLPAKPRSTLVDLDEPISASAPPQRRFTIPFRKLSRPRASSLSATPSSEPSTPISPPAPSAGRRMFTKKFKSIFKISSSEPSPTVHSKTVLKTIDVRPRRKSVRRTQPYGPPWNAPMPIITPDSPRHSLQEFAKPSHPTSWKQERTSGSFSPSELSEKLWMLEPEISKI